jgi:uncharacterized protein
MNGGRTDGESIEVAVHAALTGRQPDFLSLISLVQHVGSRAAGLSFEDGDDGAAVSPLQVCCKHGKADYVGVLLYRGTTVNTRDSLGFTSLMYAASARCIRSIHALLRAGAEPNVASNDGKTALLIAARHGCFDVTLQLLRNGADVHARSSTGHSALAYAAAYGSYPLVRLLVQYGASPTAVTYDGESVVEIAAKHGHRSIATWVTDYALLLQSGHEDGV